MKKRQRERWRCQPCRKALREERPREKAGAKEVVLSGGWHEERASERVGVRREGTNVPEGRCDRKAAARLGRDKNVPTEVKARVVPPKKGGTVVATSTQKLNGSELGL